MATDLPLGTTLHKLTSHTDDRGAFTEIFRADWINRSAPPQWNVVESQAGVLRGVHVHLQHWDYLLVVSGSLLVGLRDLRIDSPSFGLVSMVQLDGLQSGALSIPPGVAHGFYFASPATHIYGVSEYWDVQDELGCRFDDPALEMPWPCRTPILSPRDMQLSGLADLMNEIAERRRSAPSSPRAVQREAHLARAV